LKKEILEQGRTITIELKVASHAKTTQGIRQLKVGK
jgi:hypothetical protein